MKIRQIVPSVEERYGGPSRSVSALAAALAALPHEVELYSTEPGIDPAGRHDARDRLRTHVYRRDWPGRLCPSAGLDRALRTGDADIVHHHSLWLRTLHYAHRSARRADAAFVISPRGMMSRWAWNHRGGRKRFADRFVHPGAFAGADAWHATSTEEAHDIRALGFAQPICVAPNAVTVPDATEIAASRTHWCTACPAAAARPVALFFSRFHRKKRVLELIDLWLERAPREWLLLLVGIPEDYTPAMLERYVQRASGAGRVQAFSGAGAPPPYGVASLFLLPSHNENFGLVIAEAMAHGVPALVTDTTPWLALNEDERGWCVPWTDYPASLASALGEGPDRLRARGTRARAWVAREYAWSRSAGILADFYTRLRDRRAG